MATKKKKSAKEVAQGVVGLIILGGIAWIGIAIATKDADKPMTAAEAAECRMDLDCAVDPILVTAFTECRLAVEDLAIKSNADFEWTSGLMNPTFPAWGWGDKSKGIVAFLGEEIRIRGQRYSYKCQFDIDTKEVVEVTAWPGRNRMIRR
ncbi:hypothetical protein [Breoghania sp.]|uniref:hypothetical protein n=1 Tax=Breoghania sp. TaxID=2065378 RepID=UPI0029CA9B71|nr:hypothetical protein [Breoghania sp.]